MRLKHTGAIVAVVLAIYVALYLVLSVQGQYYPAVIGTNGVKAYDWAPVGFIQKNGRWSKPVTLFFFPVYVVDVRLWHTSDWKDVEKYPVHERPRPNHVLD